MKTVGAIVQSYSVDLKSLEEVNDEHEHIMKLEKLRGSVPGTLSAKARFAGFTLFVNMGIITKFKYTASILQNDTVIGYDEYWNGETHIPVPYPIIYVGDIPDFAIERIETLKELGFDRISIHSNNPFPIIKAGIASEVSLAPRIDPVVIAWTDPYLKIHWENEWWKDEDFGSGNFTNYAGNCIGVVAAMWDMDKEIAIE